jgi:hypothetical protein
MPFRSTYVLIAVVVLLMLAQGCTGPVETVPGDEENPGSAPEEEPDPDPQQDVGEDLEAYFEEVSPVLQLNHVANEAYWTAAESEPGDHEALLEALRETSIPNSAEFREKLDEIEPLTEEVREVHRILREGAELTCDALDDMVRALEEEDEEALLEAQESFDEARFHVIRWQEQMGRLSREHGVR